MTSKKMIQTLIRACVESAGQPEIICHQSNGKSFSLLSQFHILVTLPFGMGKSSLAKSIPNATISLGHTLPAIAGTINKTGQLIESTLLNSANKVFILDEAHRLDPKSVDALLSLLEQGFYTRCLGHKVAGDVKKGDFKKYGWSVETLPTLNAFTMKVRFSCLSFGERLPSFQRGAFLSRFFPVRYSTTIEDAFNFARGTEILGIFEDFKFKNYKKPIHFRNYTEYVDEVYERALPFFKMFRDEEGGYMVRTCTILAKLSAHFARMRGSEEEIEKQDYLEALKFLPIFLDNIKTAELTPQEYEIYNALEILGLNQAQVSDLLDIPEQNVSRTVDRLKKKGFFYVTKENLKKDNNLNEVKGDEIKNGSATKQN